MPIYDYECTSCPSRFELKRSFTDESPVCCPSCGSQARRRFSSVPIIFKGSGFYVTDTRGGQSYTSSASAKEDKPKESSDAGAAKSDAVAAKTESTVSAKKD